MFLTRSHRQSKSGYGDAIVAQGSEAGWTSWFFILKPKNQLPTWSDNISATNCRCRF